MSKTAMTHEELVTRMAQISPDITLLGKYINSKSRIPVRCSKCGFVWTPRGQDLLSGRSCKRCSQAARHEARMQQGNIIFLERIKEKNPAITPLEKYQGSDQKIWFKCSLCKHVWQTSPYNIVHGHGCPKCNSARKGLVKRLTQEDFETRLKEKNPDLTALGQYTKSSEPIKVKCKKCGHTWTPIAGNLLSGHGCRQCAHVQTSFMEQFVLRAFSLHLGEDAVLSRDKRLIGKELDIYLPAHKLAVEIGSWHWHKNSVENDKEKRRRCLKKGVRLIFIFDSYEEDAAPLKTDCLIFKENLADDPNHEQLKKIVRWLFSQIGENTNPLNSYWDIIATAAIENSKRISTETFISIMANKNPSIEIIGNYSASHSPIAVRCKECGRQWEPTPHNLLAGKGCPSCAGVERKETSDFLQELSKLHPGINLLNEYESARAPVSVQCSICSHTWLATPHNLLAGKGCPKCSKRKAAKKLGRKICCVETGIVYDSTPDAARKTGKSSTSIARAAKTGSPYNGFHWEYLDKEKGIAPANNTPQSSFPELITTTKTIPLNPHKNTSNPTQ